MHFKLLPIFFPKRPDENPSMEGEVPLKNIKSIIKEGDSSGRICNCRGPYDEKLVQSSWQRRAKPTIHGYLTLSYEMFKAEKRRIDAAFPIANDTDSLGMTVGANSKFLTGPIYCVLNINIISVRVDFCHIVCVPGVRSLGTQITANSKYCTWLMEARRHRGSAISLLCSFVFLTQIPMSLIDCSRMKVTKW